MLWAMNLHVLDRPSLQRVIFGGEEGEILGVHVRGYREGCEGGGRQERWIFEGIFAAIRDRKNRIKFLDDIIKIW